MEDNKRTNTGGNDPMEDKLRELTEDTQVPASLEPEQIEKMLLKKKKEKTVKYRRKYAGIAAAACLCLAVGVTAAITGQRGDDSSSGAGAGAEIASEAGNAGETAEGETTESETKIASAADYDQIYDYIQAELKYQEKQAKKQARMYSDGTASGVEEIASADSAVMDSGAAQNAAAYSGAGGGSTPGGGYSDTNVREESVGEADVVKTDGSCLYVMSGNRVEIVDIASEEMEEIAAVTVGPGNYIRELYVEGSRMAVFYTQSKYTQEDGIEVRSREFACTDVYDISDPSAPVKLNTFSQSGAYNTMRVKDGYAYVISSFYPDTASPRSDVGAYVPSVQGGTLEADRILMPEQEMGSEYTVITAFSLADPQEQTDSKAVFGSAGMCYVSGENIYVTETCYDTDDTGMSRTAVRKVAYHDGQLEGAAQAKVDGMLNDSFSIDEYNGYLRLVTTITSDNGVMPISGDSSAAEPDSSNALYVLDGELQITGEIRDLAPGETVYSARFMGDTGYFVTFRQVDPLFSVDLSDPASPQIIGELKIPGFSEYLHPYGEGLLLGIGMAVDEEGVTTEGVKLSMFDISDPGNVTEASVYVMEDMYGTDAAYDYKAVLADVEKNLFGFRAYGGSGDVYAVFSYDASEGFREVFSRELTYGGDARGLYAGERFYLVVGNTVESYTLSGFEKIDDIVLGSIEPLAAD